MFSLFAQRRSIPSPGRWLFLAVAGFLVGLAAAYMHFSPRVLSVEPGDGRLGGYTAIEAAFNVPMDAACTQDHVTLEPDIPGRMEWKDGTLRFLPEEPWPAGAAIRFSLRQGACGSSGLRTASTFTRTFNAVGSRIAFVTRQGETYLLMAADTEGGGSEELLRTEQPIQDYAVSPRGGYLVYILGSFDTASDLWLLPLEDRTPELLVDCQGDSCRNPVFSPDGLQVAFERAPMESAGSGAAFPMRPHVETVRLPDRSPESVSPDGHIANNPLWTPNGWLSYYDASDRVIVVDDLQGGKTFVPNGSGEPWSWLPDGGGLVFSEIQPDGAIHLDDEQPPLFPRHLYLVAVDENTRTDLSGDPNLDDAAPVVSPDGGRLAFTRAYLDDRWTPGRQLWLMDLSGGSALPLTDLPGYGHSSIRWSPDGKLLAFLRYHETAPYELPEVWCVAADGTDARRVAAESYLPHWLP